jgi:hypothetical protein
MNLKSWKLWSALTSAAVGAAVNFATELRNDVLAWIAVIGLTVLAWWLGSVADQERRRRVVSPPLHQISPVLRWEERKGDARRMVSTTSVRVATEFLKRVPPSL